MPKKLDFKNLRKCLDNYKAESIYIRLVGSSGGTVKANEKLESKTLDFKKNKSGLHMLIDDLEVFYFPLKDYKKGFSLDYERMDEKHRMVMLSTGIDPDDPNLPEPTRSILRTVLDYHLMEIYFEGKIPLKFHSWWIEPHWKYWTIAD